MASFWRLFNPLLLPPLIMAVSTGLIDLFPGYLLSISAAFLSSVPLLIFIYPQLLSLRGTIGGIFSGRLSTSLHLGEIRPQFSGNTHEFYTLLSVVSILYLFSASVVSLFTAIFSMFVFSIELGKVFSFIVHIFSTFSLTQLSTIPVALFIAKMSYNRGWDPDITTYPFTSSFGDLFITLYYIVIGYLIHVYNLLLIPLLLMVPLFILPFFFVGFGMDRGLFIKELKESLVSIIISGLIVTVTGYIMQSLEVHIRARPYIYFIYPALLTTIGDVGSIIGSSSTTGLNISGDIFHNYRPLIYILLLSVMIPLLFILYTILGYVLTIGFRDINIFEYVGIGLAGLFSTLIIGLFSLLVAYMTFRWSLDPDHFVIPIESTSADLLTTFSLYIVIALI